MLRARTVYRKGAKGAKNNYKWERYFTTERTEWHRGKKEKSFFYAKSKNCLPQRRKGHKEEQL